MSDASFVKSPPQDNWEEPEIRRWLRDLARRLVFGTFTLDVGNVLAQAALDSTVTGDAVKGLRVGMAVKLTQAPTLNAGLMADAWVATDDELVVRVTNVTAAPINPASGTWTFFAFGVS